MSDEMGTTTTVPTESESRLARTEQVKHTPGPWCLRKMSYGYDLALPSQGVMGGYGGWFVELHGLEPDPQKWDPEFEGNARLIATAPDMLAALKEAQYFFSEDFPDGPDAANIATPSYEEAYRAILAAISKAEGRTP